jgi:hypothetical protein
MLSILYYVHDCGLIASRYGKLPDLPFTKDDIPYLSVEQVARATGIELSQDETAILWDVCTDKEFEEYDGPREYFLDDGLLGWEYAPRTRLPGQRWRMPINQASHEISAALQRVGMFFEGYLTVKDRLVRWGLVKWFGFKIQEFQQGYDKQPEEWARVLEILDITNEDIQTVEEFITTMPSLHPAHDLIPIRVLETIAVFRIMLRLSLRQFELAYGSA